MLKKQTQIVCIRFLQDAFVFKEELDSQISEQECFSPRYAVTAASAAQLLPPSPPLLLLIAVHHPR
jgi:hypothetical protein